MRRPAQRMAGMAEIPKTCRLFFPILAERFAELNDKQIINKAQDNINSTIGILFPMWKLYIVLYNNASAFLVRNRLYF